MDLIYCGVPNKHGYKKEGDRALSPKVRNWISKECSKFFVRNVIRNEFGARF